MRMRYVPKVIMTEFLISSAAGFVLCIIVYRFKLNPKLNYEAFINAMVNLNAGIIIAVFLALFNNSNKSVQSFMVFVRATKQVYALFLINCAIACSISLIVMKTGDGRIIHLLRDQSSINLLGTATSVVFTLANLNLVSKVLSIVFRDVNTGK